MKNKFLKIFKKKWVIALFIVAVLILVGGFFVFAKKGVNGSIQMGKVTKQDLQQTVLSTGQVVSGTDLNLSFQGSGVVKRVYVKEGDKVKEGQTLAVLDQSSAMAALTTARGALAQAKANYDKLVQGATQEDIQVTANSVTSAKQDLTTSYSSAGSNLSSAYTTVFNAYSMIDGLYKSYFTISDQQGIAVQSNRLILLDSSDKLKTLVSANSTDDIELAITNASNLLSSSLGALKIIREQCDSGAYYANIPAATKTSLDTQIASVNTGLTTMINYRHSLQSYKIALQTAIDRLSLKKAPPMQAELDAAAAQMLSAQGQVDAAYSTVSHMVITAPMSGTITEVNVKVGELAVVNQKVMRLQNVGDLHVEANVSEANIAILQIGQAIDYTFDALGPDQHFTGKVLSINPASTVISGVVNYLVKGSLENITGAKPGMTVNMTTMVAQKQGVLAVPSTAVINRSNKKIVRVIDDLKKKTYHEVEVQTGLQADGGWVEILSGLSESQDIVTYMKQ